MSTLRSPDKKTITTSGSFPDLSKLREDTANSQITMRKRKFPDRDCNCTNELLELRNELSNITSLLIKFTGTQEQSMDAVNRNISDIKKQMEDIQTSTSGILLEQNKLRSQITHLEKNIAQYDEKIKSIESDLSNVKMGASSTRAAQDQILTSEKIIDELQERQRRGKNIIVARVPESNASSDDERESEDKYEIIKMLTTIIDNCPKPVKIFRLGKYNPDKTRLIKAPLPPQPWQVIYDATEHGGMCPQVDLYTSVRIIHDGDENCLFLNIYTRTLMTSNVPVMVYFHGGAFMSGSGNSDMYGPDFLLQHDIILVTINYRLEVLGFLCLDTPEVAGNAGLKDQVAALNWIKNNISQFGGNPNNVTIFGESAGSACVSYHLLSNMSKRLFHKAIAQSGTCIDDWAIQRDGKARAFRIAKLFGESIEDTNELLEFLQGLPATKLAGLSFKTKTEDESHRGLPIFFTPVVEKRFVGVDSFISEEPLDLLLAQKINRVPLMMGYNGAEGFLVLLDQIKKIEFKNEQLHYFVPWELAVKLPADKVNDFGERIKKFYVGDQKFSIETAASLIDLQSDIHFCYNVNRFLYFYAAVTQAVYAYRFNYVTDLNFMKHTREDLPINYDGACHGDDVFYLFCSNIINELYQQQNKLKEIVWKVTKLWTNFAKTGNPTPDDIMGVKWNQYNHNTKNFFYIQEPLSNGPCAEKERVAFWNKLYSEAGAPHIHKSNL